MPYFISIFCHSAASLVNSPPTGVCNKPLTRNHQSRTIRESITPMPRPQSTQISRPVTRQRTSQVCSGLGSFWFCLKSKEPVFVKNAYGGGKHNNPQSFPLPPQIIFYSMVQKDTWVPTWWYGTLATTIAFVINPGVGCHHTTRF